MYLVLYLKHGTTLAPLVRKVHVVRRVCLLLHVLLTPLWFGIQYLEAATVYTASGDVVEITTRHQHH